MATKSLTITEEAYERLRAHKREDESFTDTILRLAGGDADAAAGFGALADVEGFRDATADARDRLDDDLRERIDERVGDRADPRDDPRDEGKDGDGTDGAETDRAER
jgi:predicted CopG family antitoxin